MNCRHCGVEIEHDDEQSYVFREDVWFAPAAVDIHYSGIGCDENENTGIHEPEVAA